MQFNVQPNIPDNEINEEQSGTTTHISKPQQTDWTVSITTQNASNIIHQSNAAPSSSDQSNIETQPRAEAKNATPVNNSIHSPIQEDSCNNAAPFFAKKTSANTQNANWTSIRRFSFFVFLHYNAFSRTYGHISKQKQSYHFRTA